VSARGSVAPADPFADLILCLAHAGDRAGYTPEEVDDIAWLVLHALRMAKESGRYEDRPSLTLVDPSLRQAPTASLAQLVEEMRPLLALVPGDARAASKAPSARLTVVPDLPRDQELVERYCQHQRRRGLAKGTIYERRTKLLTFLADNPKGWAALTRDDIERSLDERCGRDGRPLTARTRAWWLSMLSVFYAWAIDEGLLEANPVARIRRPKLPKTLPRPMPDADLERAIENADPMTRCWLLLGAYQGLRCREIAGLNREDVIESNGLLRVVAGKGDRERMVPLHPEVLAALRALPMPESGAVFRRKRLLTRYPPSQLGQELNIYLRSLGIASTVHSLRHWFGTSVYRQTRDIRLTQALLGHESPETTAIYAAFDPSTSVGAVTALGFSASRAAARAAPGFAAPSPG